MGTPTDGCDITPALRSGFQTLHQVSKKSRREVDRGRDGEPGRVVEKGLDPEVDLAGQEARAKPAGPKTTRVETTIAE